MREKRLLKDEGRGSDPRYRTRVSNTNPAAARFLLAGAFIKVTFACQKMTFLQQ